MHTVITTTKGAAIMTDPAIVLIEATERLERARTEVRIAELRSSALAPGAPLRHGVEANRRLRTADAALVAAQAAFDAAQDVDCPDAG